MRFFSYKKNNSISRETQRFQIVQSPYNLTNVIVQQHSTTSAQLAKLITQLTSLTSQQAQTSAKLTQTSAKLTQTSAKLEQVNSQLRQRTSLNINMGSLKPISNQPIVVGAMPNTPKKLTYDYNTANYSISIISNFLSYLLQTEPYTPMNIPGFVPDSIVFYKYSGDVKNIGFSIVSYDAQTVLICFRGSQTAIDFVDDSKYNYYTPINGQFPPQKNPETALYTAPGFTAVYNEIKTNIITTIGTYKNIKRVYICGHSLGASLSMLLAYDLSTNPKYTTMVEVYGIAPPKTGDKLFTTTIENNCKYALSLINLADMVPSITTTYMYNKYAPNIPCSFLHVTPIAIFNNIKATIGDCHLITAYYEGIRNGSPSIKNPIVVPNVQ